MQECIVSSVQKTEKDKKRETNRLYQLQLTKKRQYERSILGVFIPLKRRQPLPRAAKTYTLPTDVSVFTALLCDLAVYAANNVKQISLLDTANTVRWSAQSVFGFNGLPSEVTEYALQIRPSKESNEWNDWLVVKHSNMPLMSGLGLFAARAMPEHQVITLYGGIATPHPPLNKEYTIRTLDGSLFVDALGSMANGNPPFLGAHMANDPNFATNEVDKTLSNCYFDEEFLVVLSKDVKADEELLIDYNRW